MTPQALISPARLAGIPLLRTQTDERLVDLVRAGNDAAFEAIVARYRRPLLGYCSKILPGTRAEDAVQQAFLRALDSLRSTENHVELRPWLYRIAHNTALNALRDRSLGHEELTEQIDGVERPDQAYEKTERLRDTVAAVSALPARQRDAVVLRELEGRSYEEIALALGVSGGAVRQLLSRARGTLQAGMTAVVPFGLLSRVPLAAGDGVGERVAEMTAIGAGGAVVTKLAATALVTGAVLGGVAAAPSGGPDDGKATEPPAATVAEDEPGEVAETVSDEAAEEAREIEDGDDRRGRNRGPGGGDDDDDNSGPGGGDDDDEDRSGPGDGSGDTQPDNSGPGSLSSGPGSLSSGPGSDGSGTDNSGSGSGTSGSGTSGSGTSGSGTSGSGTSGSGTSGSSGSGSGDVEIDLDTDSSGSGSG